MAVTNIAIKNAKPKDKTYKLAAEKGLYLEITPKGNKWWRFKYRFLGKEKRISLGVYPEVSLKEAELKRDEARKLLASGIDPSVSRQLQKNIQYENSANSFELVAREWVTKKASTWSDSHAKNVLGRFEHDIFPWLGKRPVREISAPELLTVIKRIETRGKVETAYRALQNCGQVFRYAIATQRAERDISSDLKGALIPVKVKHHPSITKPSEIGQLLRAIEGFTGSFVTLSALKLAPLVFVRPGELRHAEWSEIDLEKAEWRIPPEKMKMRITHIVPLSKQAIKILKDLLPLTGHANYVFHGERLHSRPMSENTINAALRRLGYPQEVMTGHGFRSMASTLLNEQGWNPDAIERQLAHGERNKIRGAYNFAEYLSERVRMMQHWADYLDQLASMKPS